MVAENIVSQDNKFNTSIDEEKPIVNTTTSGQITNCTRGSQLSALNNMSERSNINYSSTNINSDFSKGISAVNTKKNFSYNITQNTKFGTCPNEDTIGIANSYVKQQSKCLNYKNVNAMSTVSSECPSKGIQKSSVGKSLIKQPRLTLPENYYSSRGMLNLPKDSVKDQKSLQTTNASKMWPQQVSTSMSTSSTWFRPSLCNEGQYVSSNNSAIKSLPQLSGSNFSYQLPPGTTITQAITPHTHATLERPSLYSSNPQFAYLNKISQIGTTNKQTSNNVLVFPFSRLHYSTNDTINHAANILLTDILPANNTKPNTLIQSRKQNTLKNTKKVPRQKSQKGPTSRKKSSTTKNNKSNANASLNISGSTTKLTQADNSIDMASSLSTVDNMLSQDTNIQSIYKTVNSNTQCLLEKNLINDTIEPSESKSSSTLDTVAKFTNIIQLQSLQKQTSSLRSPAHKMKRSKIPVRRKPKEKVKKTPTRKKQTMTVVSELDTAKNQAMPTESMDVPSCSSQPTSLIPEHISDIMYPSAPNSDLIKAFNNYWSSQISYCAICVPFASCESGNSRVMTSDWKYCESTVLPESTPIWVK